MWFPSAIITKPSCFLQVPYHTTCWLCRQYPENRIGVEQCLCLEMWVSPRPISICQLHTLRRFHPKPINLVIFKGSYILGNLILRGASRLDAFSAYPFHTWLSSRASGETTGTPAVCPSRSSRTKDSSSQISYARDR